MLVCVPMFSVIAIAVCVLQFAVVLLLSNVMPRVMVDIFKTSVHVVSDTLGNSSYVYRAKPVDIDMLHNVNATALLLLLSGVVAAFALLTRRIMEQLDGDKLNSPFAVENTEVSRCPSVGMWNLLFIGIIAAAHVVLVLVVNTPCSVEFIALACITSILPLAVISLPQPLSGSRHVYNTGDTVPPPLFCGFPPHVAYVTAFAVAAFYSAVAIPYDPTGLKLQAAAAITLLDLFALCLGHLWDSPPSVNTIVNSRLFYCCCVSCANIAVLTAFNSWFPTRYTPY